MNACQWWLYVRRSRSGRGQVVAVAEGRTCKDNEYPPSAWDEVARGYNDQGYDVWARYTHTRNGDTYIGDVWRSWYLMDLGRCWL